MRRKVTSDELWPMPRAYRIPPPLLFDTGLKHKLAYTAATGTLIFSGTGVVSEGDVVIVQ